MSPATSICYQNWRNSWKDIYLYDDEDVIRTERGWQEDQDQEFFDNGIRALEKHRGKHISVRGEYVE